MKVFVIFLLIEVLSIQKCQFYLRKFAVSLDFFYFLGNGTSMKNMNLFELLLKNPPLKPMSKNSKNLLFNYVLDGIGVSELKITNQKIVQNAIHNFCTITSRLWLKSARNSKKLRNKNYVWR